MQHSDAGSQPLVSVVLPTYNRGELLKRAISSVFSQTYSNWELIVWDDGSSDDTEAAVSSFQDRRIKYCRDANHGQSHALNAAIHISTGDFVAFLDDDDEWVAEKLALQVRIMETTPDIDILFSDFLNLNMSTKEQGGGFDHCKEGLELLDAEEVGPTVYRVLRGVAQGLLCSNFIAFDTAIVRRRVFGLVGCFDERLRNSQDLEFWCRAEAAQMRFAYSTKRLMLRRKYSDSLSSPSIATSLNKIRCLDICLAQVNGKGLLLPDLRAAYRRAWLGLGRQYSLERDRSAAVRAILKSLNYGFTRGALYEIWRLLGNERTVRLLRRRHAADTGGEVPR